MSARLLCRRCGSAATHSIVMGMPSPALAESVVATPWQRLGGCVITPGLWTAECLTCGQKETVDDVGPHFDDVSAPDDTVARAITTFAAQCRDQLDQDKTSIVSHAGLWLLLASVAEHVTGEDAERVAQVLGMPLEDATAAAHRLLAEPHPTLAATFGAWAAKGVVTPLPGINRSVPDQAWLDQWASEHTHGLIDRFPVQVDLNTLLLLATAFVLEPRWTKPMYLDEDDRLVLDRGLQTIIRTEAAGLVAIAKPFSEDAIDVLSVIAAAEVPPSQVWKAVDEVAELLSKGALWHAEKPADTPDVGHAWTCRTQVETIVRGEEDTGAHGTVHQWRSHLRRWSVQAAIDFDEAPGLVEICRALLPGLDDPEFTCAQSVRGEFDEDGFRAAAVTALGIVTGMPDFVEARVERVNLDFAGPHAVVAIARGGAWEGIPLVSAWVTPQMSPDPDENREVGDEDA